MRRMINADETIFGVMVIIIGLLIFLVFAFIGYAIITGKTDELFGR